MIYMGIYSNRPGTFADRKYPDDIPYSVKHERRSRLNKLLYQISTENNQQEIGKIRTRAEEITLLQIRTMMINEIDANGDLYGYTDNMKQITVKANAKTKGIKI